MIFSYISLKFLIITACICVYFEKKIPDFKFVWDFVFHPVIIYGKIISFIDKHTNIGNKYVKFINGAIFPTFVLTVTFILFYKIDKFLFDFLDPITLFIIHANFIFVMICGYQLKQTVKNLFSHIINNNIEDAKKLIPHICARNPENLDEHMLKSSGIESLYENLSDGIIAPIFYYLIFSLPGLMVYKFINTFDSMIGYRSEKYFYFGKFMARVDDMVNYIPSRICAIIVYIAVVFTHGTNKILPIKHYFKYANKHISPNAGQIESIISGGLEIKLGGVRYYGNKKVDSHIGYGEINEKKMVKSLTIFNKTLNIYALIILSILIIA